MSNSGKCRCRAPADCPCRGSSLDRLLQPRILALLAAAPLHGYRLAGQVLLASRRGPRPDPAGLYRSLRLLERRGLLDSAWTPSRSGPDRRLYRLTGPGRRCLAAWMRTLGDYRKEIGMILRIGKEARGRRPAGAVTGRAGGEMGRG